MSFFSSFNRVRHGVMAVATVALLTTPALAGPPVVGPQVRVDNNGTTFAANETSAASADPNSNEIVMTWNDWRRSTGQEIINMGVAVSLDGGATWTDFLVRPPAQWQTNVEGDPMTAYDNRTGTLWVGAIAFGGGGTYVARKDAGATTFQPSVMIRTGSGQDKCWMSAGPAPGNPNLTYMYMSYNLGTHRSIDMGQTWTGPVSNGSGIGFNPRVGPNGEVYVASWDFGSGHWIQRSLNGGQSFEPRRRIATRMDVWGTQDGSRFPGNFRVPAFVYIAVDPNDGTLYATYSDTTNVVNGQRNVDIYFSKSTDGGQTWSSPVIINGDNNPPGDQAFSWIEVDQAGRIHMVFLDSRHTVQNDNVLNGFFDVYYSYSEDGGATWNEHRLTPNSFNCADDGLNRGQQFLGDYFGIALGGNRVYPSYLSTQNGDPDIFTNVIVFLDGLPDTFNVTHGTLQGGGLAEVAQSDDQYMVIQQKFAPTVQDPEAGVEFETTAAVSSPSEFSFTLEASCNVVPAGATQTIELFNYDTNAWDEVDSRTATQADSVVEVTIDTNPGRYIQNGTDRMKTRTRWFRPSGPVLFVNWVARIDQAVWAFVE